MFDNTITVDFDSAPRALVEINQDKYSSEYRYRSPTLSLVLAIRHSSNRPTAGGVRRDRHNMELVATTWDVNGRASIRKSYIVLENDENIAAGDADDPIQCLLGFLSVEANRLKLVGWES